MLHYQSAVTSSQFVGQRNPFGDNIALWQSFAIDIYIWEIILWLVLEIR